MNFKSEMLPSIKLSSSVRKWGTYNTNYTIKVQSNFQVTSTAIRP